MIVVYQIFRGIETFLSIVSWILIAYCVMSWFVRPTNGLYQFLARVAQPILAPFRPIAQKLIERGFMVDVSAILAIFAIRLLSRLMWFVFGLLI